MTAITLGFQDVDTTRIAAVGGKGANLGELAGLDGVHVPDGFCVTTEAFKRAIGDLGALLDTLTGLNPEDRDGIRDLSAEIRAVIEGTAIPADIQEAISSRLTEDHAYAVRSSATAEDLPTASFAGQQDTYLNVIGKAAILDHVRRCWASLFTERAVTYRIQHGFDHRKVHMAVVVQRMVFPQAAGIMFTADPVTSNRKVVTIDATFGLGEALVAGLVNADAYQVRDGAIIGRKVAAKKIATFALSGGGTEERELEPERQERQALTDAQVLDLAHLGRTIEAHFGQPQDVEWCLVDGAFHLVQSRPITTLFPLPEVGDDALHVYLSVGHQQMMTDPMKPLGLSMWQLTAARPMLTAAGRLFVDVAPQLASPARNALLEGFGKSDPVVRDAFLQVLARGDFGPPAPAPAPVAPPASPQPDPEPGIVAELIAANEASLGAMQRDIRTKSGTDAFDFILEDVQELKRLAFEPRSSGVVMLAINAALWLNDTMATWLGEKGVTDALTLSVANNVTSEMGLALLDVADAVRPHPAVLAYLRGVENDGFLEGLAAVEGGQVAREAIAAYLNRYGMRCTGEIDVTRPRWAETPAMLVPLILANVQNFEPGARARRFEEGRQVAARKEQELLERLRQLPDGEEKATEAKRMIDRLRTFIGYREYPKYAMISRYFEYRKALVREADALVRAGVLGERDDAYFLVFDELREAVRTGLADRALIARRKADHAHFEKLTPPRVMTSDGEVFSSAYQRADLPPGAIVGLGVSAGVVEGRARVLTRIEGAELEEGDILVTPFTDPSWTPLFVAIKGLVTEVGGLMTHGAVIAREYGLPAVVAVENATRLIKDGQRIRVNGAEGYVEIL